MKIKIWESKKLHSESPITARTIPYYYYRVRGFIFLLSREPEGYNYALRILFYLLLLLFAKRFKWVWVILAVNLLMLILSEVPTNCAYRPLWLNIVKKNHYSAKMIKQFGHYLIIFFEVDCKWQKTVVATSEGDSIRSFHVYDWTKIIIHQYHILNQDI